MSVFDYFEIKTCVCHTGMETRKTEKHIIVGNSPAIVTAKDNALKAARTSFSVFILGERGTGKELFARFIHKNSLRADKPFIAVNCAAIPESMMDSELFGIEDRAATGVKAHAGVFEAANGGAIFLDEIADMPPPAQAKILRVLQEREVSRIGSRKSITVDVRIIAATNKVKEIYDGGEFRADLRDRLNEIPLVLPPLRERVDDIVPLLKHFLEAYGNQADVTRVAYNLLERYAWPGNVRELETFAKRIVTFGGENPKLSVRDLLKIFPELDGGGGDRINARAEKASVIPKERHVQREILDYLSQNGAAGRGCVCTELGLSPTTFKRHIGDLCAGKAVVPTGNGKATKYRVPKPDGHAKGVTEPPGSGDLDSRRQALARYLMSSGQISRAEYQGLTGVSSATACRDLQAMVETGFIFKKGWGRAVKYLRKSGERGTGEGA